MDRDPVLKDVRGAAKDIISEEHLGIDRQRQLLERQPPRGNSRTEVQLNISTQKPKNLAAV